MSFTLNCPWPFATLPQNHSFVLSQCLFWTREKNAFQFIFSYRCFYLIVVWSTMTNRVFEKCQKFCHAKTFLFFFCPSIISLRWVWNEISDSRTHLCLVSHALKCKYLAQKEWNKNTTYNQCGSDIQAKQNNYLSRYLTLMNCRLWGEALVQCVGDSHKF